MENLQLRLPILRRDNVVVFVIRECDFCLSYLVNKFGAYLNGDDKIVALEKNLFFNKKRYILKKIFMNHILSVYADCTPHEVVITKTKNGKPFLSSHLNLNFSVSDTNDIIIFALADGANVGVDIESIKERNIPFLKMAKRFFSAAEYEQLIDLPDEKQWGHFLNLWVLKESYLKALGVGLRGGLSSCEFIYKRSMLSFSCINIKQKDADQWCFFLFSLWSEFRIALSIDSTSCIEYVEFVNIVQ